MTAYLIRSGVCMVLLFGLYSLILRKEKLFSFNRFYLIFSVLFSLAVPFVSIPVEIGTGPAAGEIAEVFNNIKLLNSGGYPEVTAQQNSIAEEMVFTETAVTHALPQPVQRQADHNGIAVILLIIYLAGLTLMAARFLRNLMVVQRMIRRAEKIDQKWYSIALLDNLSSPFSFLRTVFLDRQDYRRNRIPANVLRHELEHVRQAHSHDVIFFEIMNMFFWFNPMVYLYEQAARINHEYLADEAVVRNSHDRDAYEGELIKFIRCRASVPFTCGLNSSMIKDRLLMLNTVTSGPGRKIRAAVTMFMSVLLMTLLTIRPAYPGEKDDRHKKKTPYGDDIVIEDVYFRDQNFRTLKAGLIIDGRKINFDDTARIDPEQVKRIAVLQGRKAIRKYGKDGKNGVVEIITYQTKNRTLPDSSLYKPRWTVNNKVPEGAISIPVANLYSLSMLTWPIFPEQDSIKRWRLVEIMTRDFYRIKGTVIRKNGDPFPGVKLSSTGNPIIARSDKDGRFLLEDVGEDAVVTVTGEGCEPLYFRAFFKHDLRITLDRNSEPDFSLDSEGHLALDFSGRWRFRELNGGPNGAIEIIYYIHQYGSDSILIRQSRKDYRGRDYISESVYAFNTIRRIKTEPLVNRVSTVICSVSPDGNSFTETNVTKSTIGLFEEYKLKNTWSMSDDGNQLIISSIVSQGTGSDKEKELPDMVFERMREEE